MKKVFMVLALGLIFSVSTLAQEKPDPQYFNDRTVGGKLGMITIAMQNDPVAIEVDWSDEWKAKVLVFHVGKAEYRFQASYMSYWEPVLINIRRVDSQGNAVFWEFMTSSVKISGVQYHIGLLSLSDDGRCLSKKGDAWCTIKPFEKGEKLLLNKVKKEIPAYQKECFEFLSRRYGYWLL